MRLPLVVFACALVALPAPADELIGLPVMEPPRSDSRRGEWVLNLVPRAFQQNPEIEMSIKCRVTPFGGSYPAATREFPVYYIIHDAGQQLLGEPVAGEAPPKDLDKFLVRALSTNGYLPADEAAHPPELVLIYHWGSSYAMDLETQLMFPQLDYQQRMERAKLIGDGTAPQRYAGLIMDQRLYYQERHSLFFTVVSAYDHASVVRGKPELVWRAHLTANAEGVAMREALPALILTAGTTFGRDSRGAHYVTRRALRGKVELAPLVILPGEVAVAQPK